MTLAPKTDTAPLATPLLSAMRERWVKDERPLEKQQDDNALYTGYFIGQFGDLPVGKITKPVLAEFMDLLLRCPRNVPHAIRRASLAERIAWGERPANLKQRRLARRTVNAKGLGSVSAALTVAEKLGHIVVNPCSGMGLPITEADVVRRRPYSPRDLKRIFTTSIYVAPIDIPVAGCGAAAHWLPLLASFTGARLEELGQLLVGDVKQVDGVWCIHITDLPDAVHRVERIVDIEHDALGHLPEQQRIAHHLNAEIPQVGVQHGAAEPRQRAGHGGLRLAAAVGRAVDDKAAVLRVLAEVLRAGGAGIAGLEARVPAHDDDAGEASVSLAPGGLRQVQRGRKLVAHVARQRRRVGDLLRRIGELGIPQGLQHAPERAPDLHGLVGRVDAELPGDRLPPLRHLLHRERVGAHVAEDGLDPILPGRLPDLRAVRQRERAPFRRADPLLPRSANRPAGVALVEADRLLQRSTRCGNDGRWRSAVPCLHPILGYRSPVDYDRCYHYDKAGALIPQPASVH